MTSIGLCQSSHGRSAETKLMPYLLSDAKGFVRLNLDPVVGAEGEIVGVFVVACPKFFRYQ